MAGRGSTAQPSASDPARTRRRVDPIAALIASGRQGAPRRSQSKTRWRSVVRLAAVSTVPSNSSPTDIRPGPSSTIARNRAMRAGKSGWSRSYTMDLPVPGRGALAGRVRQQVGLLQERVEDVQSEAVDTARKPAADHRRVAPLRPPDRANRAPAAGPGTCGSRTARGAVPTPSPGPPKNDSQLFGGSGEPSAVEAGRIAPQIPVGERPGPRRARRDEPGMLVAGVVHDQVEDDPDAASVSLVDEPVEIRRPSRTAGRPSCGR